MSESVKKIASILRADKDTIAALEQKMYKRFGFENAMDWVYGINKERMDIMHKQLGLTDPTASGMYSALIRKIEEDDEDLRMAIGNPVCGLESGCKTVLGVARKIARVGEGYFLKWSKAEEFLRANPPKNIMSFLGYHSVDEMLKHEDVRKVYAALRFAEDRQWLNEVFFSAYKNLRSGDFERRYIDTVVMDEKFVGMAEKFLKKKYHNVSHLKELGLIFVLPQHLGVSGEVMRMLALVLHYFYEIDFYSRLFRHYAANENSGVTDNRPFADLFISGLRGDVIDKRLDDGNKLNWMIVQAYLAKDDMNDWRLFEPHVNPEALHWGRAEEDISHIGHFYENVDLSFWYGLGFIGDYYRSDTGIDVLVSCNLVDTAMALVQKKKMDKYLYHHQEALWNKIFMTYIGEEEMRELIIRNFHKGFIAL
jgi:hypothetical protein